jgi:FAD/FMN-containing dehydrogenase
VTAGVKRGRSVRRGAALIALVAAAVVARPALHLSRTALRDTQDRRPPPAGSIDDASALDQAPVAEIWNIPADPALAEAQLVALVQRARAGRIPVSVAGARHSMGGDSIRRDGIVLNMLPFHAMSLDPARNLLHVQAGARWSEVLPYLNATGRSVAVMQSNNSFSVGGSISVNCHGWQARRPPIASTVLSFRILRPDGGIARCSRSENAELFSLALGGYGLFGVILDVELRVVPNREYRLERVVTSVEDYPRVFGERVAEGRDVEMAYGRLSVAPESFLREAILSVYHRVPAGDGQPSRVAFPEISGLTRLLFRGQVGSDYGKSLRWRAEKSLGGALGGGTVHRNELLGEPVDVFENRSAESTDILHEYFVPAASFAPFVSELRDIVPRHGGDLLNVTVRDLRRDDDTFLRYADQDLLALVMLFNQHRTPEGEAAMRGMTRALVDAALRHGGRYYLPYRLHATREQLEKAYPQARRFFELKRRYDPDAIFQNAFSLAYSDVDTPPSAEAP